MEDIERILRAALEIEAEESFDGDLDYQEPQVPIRAQAAVMVMVNIFEEPTITLTKRTHQLRQHSGQVAFPGGRIDATDISAWDAALRETREEIGLPDDHHLEPLGALSIHKTITGFEVTPFLAINPAKFRYRPEEGEVAEVFEIPFSLLQTSNFVIGSQKYQGQDRHYFELPYKEYFIWGATARILHQLASRLEHAEQKARPNI